VKIGKEEGQRGRIYGIYFNYFVPDEEEISIKKFGPRLCTYSVQL
jgi:hypothetical protein